MLGGSLADAISENYRIMNYFNEGELKDLLLQVGRGLRYIHSMSLVHMDIKPSKYSSCTVWSLGIGNKLLHCSSMKTFLLFIDYLLVLIYDMKTRPPPPPAPNRPKYFIVDSFKLVDTILCV